MNEVIDQEQTSAYQCPICGSFGLWVFYTVNAVPASCNRLWESKEDAVNCPKGSIKLAFCRSCAHVSNVAIEPEKNRYDIKYDNSLFYSAHFQEFAKKLSNTLIERYNLHGKNIVEIGGGKVDFLSLLVGIGQNCGIRFNPFHSKVKNTGHGKTIPSSSVSGSFPFGEKGKKVNFVFSYHELEHMNDPKSFLNFLWMMLDKRGSAQVFFSVPNALKAFEEGDYSDIIYEHVSYFTIPSLCFLFSRCGFEISSFQETKGEIFDSIHVEATPKRGKINNFSPISELTINQIEQIIQKFSAKTLENIKQRSQQLIDMLNEGNRIIVWGAGARGVTFLNIFRDQRIEYVVDINPHKHSMYVPGTGQKIVSPKFLLEYKPDVVALANPAYKEEIKKLLDDMSISAIIISI